MPAAGKTSSRRSSKDRISGDEYEGELNKQGKREGKGTCKFATGETFEGEWRDGKMHGKGRLALADGDVFEGTWRNGAKSGPGVRECRLRVLSIPSSCSCVG